MKLIIDIDEEMYKDANILIVKDFPILKRSIAEGTPLPKCNQCKYYEGVHNVQGHAPCEYHKIGGVLWNWYCSQFEADKDSE